MSFKNNNMTHQSLIYIWHANDEGVFAVQRWTQQHICCDNWFTRSTGPYEVGLFIHTYMQWIQMFTSHFQLQRLDSTDDDMLYHKDHIWCCNRLINEGLRQQWWFSGIEYCSVYLCFGLNSDCDLVLAPGLMGVARWKWGKGAFCCRKQPVNHHSLFLSFLR